MINKFIPPPPQKKKDKKIRSNTDISTQDQQNAICHNFIHSAHITK